MRITGGFLRGRTLQSPQTQSVRPTADKTRLAVFNMLESRGLVRDARVLDAFCGTGALAIEAISRGGASAVLLDQDRVTLDLARANAQHLGIAGQCQFMLADMRQVASLSGLPATLVFLDPPYRQGLVAQAMRHLVDRGLSAPDAVYVIETEKEWVPDWPFAVDILVQKTYGQSAVYMVQCGQQN